MVAAGRADRLIADALHLSRAAVRELIEAGAVRANGRRVAKGAQLQSGVQLEVVIESLPAVVCEPDAPLAVLHTSPAFVVLDKPPGLACHPLRRGEGGTLANALVARFPACAGASDSPREGGLCHRLDRETSGTIVAARTRHAFEGLRAQFRARTVEKVYWALVRGALAAERGRIELPLTGNGKAPRPWRHPHDGPALPALTHYRVLARAAGPGEGCTWLEVHIETGVRYQIRAHLAALGHPLWGDALYGGGEPPPGLGRHLLHARSLGFLDPQDLAPVAVDAPLPADAGAVLASLGLSGAADS